MSLEFLTQWRLLLAELGDLGEVLCAAIEADDVFTAISAMAQGRRVLSALTRVEAPLRVKGTAAELEALAEVSTLTVRASIAQATMQRWLERGLPGDATLLGSPLGVAVVADASLPLAWDYDTDVVVLIGEAMAPVADVLAALGQRRMVLHDVVTAEVPPSVITTQEDDEILAAVGTMTPLPPGRLVVRAAHGVERTAIEAITEQVRAVLSDLRIHRNTVQAFSRTWLDQGIANLPALAKWPSIAAADERFVGKPMVIVAPGPSLAKNIAQVAALKGKAIITAFSHSLKPLIAAGITPDLVVTVDPQDVRYHFASCAPEQLVALVNGATVHPALFELGAPRCLTLSANCAIDDWIFDGVGEEAMAVGGGSVATTAFSLAKRWRCDPIIFVGLDLSFPGGQYYVSTSTDGDARAVVDAHGTMTVEGWSRDFHAMKSRGGPAAQMERTIELRGWAGGTVPSSFMFSMFHRWFEEQLAVGGVGTVYNCTEGGAFIEGMDHRALAEVAPLLTGTIDVAAELDAVIASVDPVARRRRMAEHLTSYARGLRRAGKLAEKARRLARRVNQSPIVQAELNNVERELSAALKPLVFASMLAQRQIERAEDVALRDGAARTFLDASVALFDTLIDVVDHLEPTLRDALARLTPPRTRARRRTPRVAEGADGRAG
jgi:hypothetical protein